MTKEQLKEQFAVECTTLDKNGYTCVKGTPMDIIDWIANKFCLSDNKDNNMVCSRITKCKHCKVIELCKNKKHCDFKRHENVLERSV